MKTNKPRQFWIRRHPHWKQSHVIVDVMNKKVYSKDIHVIELAPMLKLMEEMIDTFDKFSKIRSLPLTDINDSDEEIANQYSSVIDGFIFRSKEIIESYKAFKRENGLE